MGVTCLVHTIDHENGVVRAGPALVAAQRGDLTPLRSVVRELLAAPREVDEAAAAVRRARLKKLEALHAPDVILANERRMLELATGAGRDPSLADRASQDELERLHRTWSRQSFTDLDKAWDLMHWFEDEARRRRGPASEGVALLVRDLEGLLAGRTDEPGDFEAPAPSGHVIERALYGVEPLPPVVPSDSGGYNPPAAAAEIAAELTAVDPARWALDAFSAVPAEALPYPLHGRGPEAEDVEYARYHFEALRRAYARAARLGHGVAISYG